MWDNKRDLELKGKIWWDYVHEDLKELLSESLLLLEKDAHWEEKFHDYSFVVFPAAKAYEGFLKKLFLDLGFITQEDFYGKRFRVGKALNPALPKRIREEEGGYDKIVEFCNGHELADRLWEAWKKCRNETFHWFPEEKNAISLEESGQKVAMVIETMDLAFKECKVDIK